MRPTRCSRCPHAPPGPHPHLHCEARAGVGVGKPPPTSMPVPVSASSPSWRSPPQASARTCSCHRSRTRCCLRAASAPASCVRPSSQGCRSSRSPPSSASAAPPRRCGEPPPPPTPTTAQLLDGSAGPTAIHGCNRCPPDHPGIPAADTLFRPSNRVFPSAPPTSRKKLLRILDLPGCINFACGE